MNSENKRAEKIVWLRKCDWIIIDEPCELGYHCPVCEYPQIQWHWYDERLTRSEYNAFLRCSVCNKDYPSFLCMPDLDKATDLFLDYVESIN